MKMLAAALSGVVFGAGLALSGMTNPARVLNFLDFVGAWDPTLAFVLGGAVVVATLAFRIARRWPRSLLGEPIDVPLRRDIDARLVTGATLFGVGWGLVGLCPGPAIANVGSPSLSLYVFITAMMAGIIVQRLAARAPFRDDRSAAVPPPSR